MHLITLVHSDPRNFKKFEEWINSRDYGSRAYCREFRFYDINIQEKHLDKLLGDLKYYYKEEMIGLKKKSSKIIKVVNFIMKRLNLKPISMKGIKKTPKKWFEGIKFDPKICHGLYLYPLGGIKDRFDKYGHEEI